MAGIKTGINFVRGSNPLLIPETLSSGLKSATYEAHPDIVAALFKARVPMTPGAIGSLWGKDGYQDPRVVQLYLDRGLRPRKCTTSRGEPLLRFLPADCARLLLERGVDPNRCGPRKVAPLKTALDHASEDNGALFDLLNRSDVEFSIRFLLAKGLDPNSTSPEWGTPVHCAVRFGMTEVIKTLLDAGADPTSQPECTKFGSQSPIRLAELKILRSDDCRPTKSQYKTILKLPTDAQARRTASTTALYENPNMDAKNEYASNSAQANAEKSRTSENATESAAKKRRINKQQPAVKNTSTRDSPNDNISSRTRSRVKVVS